MEAALKGAGQIGFTILSLTVSLIAVLIPLLFMGDVVGRLFREFAVTLAVTIVISAVVSLTLTPMMSARILRHRPNDKQTRFYRVSENVLQSHDRLLRAHAEGRAAATRRSPCSSPSARWCSPSFSTSSFPKASFPVQDTGVIQGISQASQSISFAAMAQKQQELAKVILEDPAVESLSSFIGADGTNTTLNSGRISINLKPIEQRKMSASDVIRRLQTKSPAGARHHSLHAAGAEHHGRRPRQPHAVSVHARRSRRDELNAWSNKFVAS